ncbi:hypothetical protein ACFV2H_17255 [Streptomyces sp. NPDC059629]|uniref:hypothetical protein n=1 Tax=Streptomyces sp. NPDC059629 TaxID=3346889 RepID=UPI00369D9561
MTHPHSKRLPRRGGLAAVAGIGAALGIGPVPSAEAAGRHHPAPDRRWAGRAHGFASLAGGTTGGAGGKGVTVTDRLDPAAAVPALLRRCSGPQARIGH